MFRFLFFLFLFCSLPLPVWAVVEIGIPDHPKKTIEEIYLRDGIPFLALDDVLPILELQGDWDSVEHVYRIRTPQGRMIISPGSKYLRMGERFLPLDPPPRFIDGRLRVSEEFVSVQLPSLLGISLYYRNTAPTSRTVAKDENSLDTLFAFLLRKKEPKEGASGLRGIAIDPGHGGQEPGALGPYGVKEKDVALQLARKLEKRLKMHFSFPIYLSRDDDYGLTLKQRLETAARPDVDALVSLHAQASFSPLARGMTLFVRPQEENLASVPAAGEEGSMRLAKILHDALTDAGFTVANIVKAPLLPLGRGDLPTVLIELGYLSNPEDRDLLTTDEGRDKIAAALFRGLRDFAGEQKEFRP